MSQETEPAAQARLSKLLGGEVTRQMGPGASRLTTKAPEQF